VLLSRGSARVSNSFASPAFYALRHTALSGIDKFLEMGAQTRGDGKEVPVEFADTPGALIGWLVAQRKVIMRAAPLSGRFDIADLGQWKETLTHFSMVLDKHLNRLPQRIISRVCARIGLLGNPSDGFGGKTISVSIHNFHAEVTLRPSRRLVIVAHPEFDPNSFSSLEHLAAHTDLNGYYGGLRLLKATCRTFAKLCRDANVDVTGNFTMSYSTTIPRMVGLAGSSAIITAAFKGLMKFYGLKLADLKLSKGILPQKILDIETAELGISAGLQDRVIQVYGGMVHMDFDSKLIQSRGFGEYTSLDPSLLPTLYLAWNTEVGEESGKVHSNAKARWLKGEKMIVDGMMEVGSFADDGKEVLEKGQPFKLAHLMEKNFALRRKMYGDAVVGTRNIELVKLAKEQGMAAKFSGSGGAVVCMRIVEEASFNSAKKKGKDPFAFTQEEEEKIRLLFISKGYEFSRLHPNLVAPAPAVGAQKSTSYFASSSAEGLKTPPRATEGIVLQID